MQITISYLLILLIVSDLGSGPHAAQHALRRAALLAAVLGHGPAVARPQGLVRAGPAPGRDLGPQWMSFSMSKMDLIFGEFLQIFGGLVIGCIKTKFCNKKRGHLVPAIHFSDFSGSDPK